MEPTHYANKTILRSINDFVRLINYNRTWAREALEDLDDGSIIAVTPIMMHEHACGKAVDPHYRCLLQPVNAAAKKNWPGEFILMDIPIDFFDALPEHLAIRESGDEDATPTNTAEEPKRETGLPEPRLPATKSKRPFQAYRDSRN